MSKLYIFGIGGTGSRVLKSLTMLMAAGVKINMDEIVPIIIDPDHSAADLTRTVKLMEDYNKVYNKIAHDSSRSNTFFNTKINLSIIPSARLPLDNTTDIQNAASWAHDFGDGNGKIAGAYGPFFIRLSVPGHQGIGIHGTHDETSIGTRATEGCIRLKNEDLEKIVKKVKIGDVVVITPSKCDINETGKTCEAVRTGKNLNNNGTSTRKKTK